MKKPLDKLVVNSYNRYVDFRNKVLIQCDTM